MKLCIWCHKYSEESEFPRGRNYCKPCSNLIAKVRRHLRKGTFQGLPVLVSRTVRIFYSDDYYAGQVLECFTCGEDLPGHRFEKQRGRFTKGKILRYWCKDCRLRKRRYNARKYFPSDTVLEPWQRQIVCKRVIQQWWDKVKSGEIPLPGNMGVIDHLGGPRSNDVPDWKKNLPPSYPVWD